MLVLEEPTTTVPWSEDPRLCIREGDDGIFWSADRTVDDSTANSSSTYRVN